MNAPGNDQIYCLERRVNADGTYHYTISVRPMSWLDSKRARSESLGEFVVDWCFTLEGLMHTLERYLRLDATQ